MKKVKAQSHPQELPQPSSLHPKIPSKPRYLRRVLDLNQNQGENLIRLNLKRIHVRKIDEWLKNRQTEAVELSKTHKKCMKKKLFKNLTHLNMYSFFHPYWIEDLKHSKRLTEFCCSLYTQCSNPQTITKYFLRFGKDLQKIEFYQPEPLSKANFVDLKRMHKAIGSFSKLKTYLGNVEPYSKSTKEEFLDLEKYMNRLRHLQNFPCHFIGDGQVSPGPISKNKIFPKVTNLSTYLNIFWRAPKQHCHFASFPNLKQLTLTSKDYFSASNSSLKKSFRDLCCLEKLHLKLDSADTKLDSLFKALLELPQLSSFSLMIDFLTPVCWRTLIQFSQRQTKLVSMSLYIKKLNPRKGGCSAIQPFEDFLASLKHKPHLQYLSIKCNYFPLPNLSQGFKQITDSCQLKFLELHVHGVGFGSVRVPLENPLQGLCEFLLRNKNTLSELRIDPPLFREQKFNEELSNAISQLSQLTYLRLDPFVQSIFEIESAVSHLSGCLNKSSMSKNEGKVWDACLDKILPQLPKLEKLVLGFLSFQTNPPKDRKWISKAFKVVPSLKRLKEFDFIIPTVDLTSAEVAQINSSLDKLLHLNRLEMRVNWDFPTADAQSQKIIDKVKALRLRRALRVDIAF